MTAVAVMLVACACKPRWTVPPKRVATAAKVPIAPSGPLPGAGTVVALRLRIPLPRPPETLAWSPGGTRIVVGDDRGAAQIRDARTGTVVHDLGQLPTRVTAIAISEAHVAVAGSKLLRVWAATTGALERELPGQEGPVLDLRLVGEVLHAVDHGNTLRRWDLRSGRAETISVPTIHERSLALAPDGGALALGGYGTVEVLDLPGAARRFKLEMPNCSKAPEDLLCAESREVEIHEHPIGSETPIPYTMYLPDWHVTDLAFSADGARMVLGRSDGVAVVIDAATGEPLARFAAGVGQDAAVALTSDGSTLAIGDHDGLIAVWDVASRRELRAVYEPYQAVGCLAFSRDDTSLAAGGPGQSVTIWDLDR